MKLTCIIPCWKRPKRTLRLIDSILKQNFEDYEAIFIGDKCPEFQKFLDDGTFSSLNNGKLTFLNLENHYGGWGSVCRGEGIKLAKGQYICFIDNDDIVLPNHFSNYTSFMEANPDIDFAYFNAYTAPWRKERQSALTRGGIGNAELILKSQVLKDEYQVDLEYEHDWRLVDKLMKKGYKHKKSSSPYTYIIMSVPNYRETGID